MVSAAVTIYSPTILIFPATIFIFYYDRPCGNGSSTEQDTRKEDVSKWSLVIRRLIRHDKATILHILLPIEIEENVF